MSATVFSNARIVDPSRGLDVVGTVIVDGKKILAAGAAALNQGTPDGAEIIDCSGKAIIPGLVDARVFIGEPGAEHRETIASASIAAAAGGVTSIVMIGSKITGLAFSTAFLKPMEPAILNAISDESTSW